MQGWQSAATNQYWPFWPFASPMYPTSSHGWSSYPPAAQAPIYQGLHEIMQLLQADEVHRHDMEAILDSADATSTASRSMVSQIVATKQFESWSRSPGSQRLFIEDNYSDDMLEAGGALSWFSALVTKSRWERVAFVPVFFFCGRHTESDDRHRGVSGMVRSLASQLCQQLMGKFGVGAAPVVSSWHHNWSLANLLVVLESLARQLPSRATLVCILDGVNHFENEENEKDILSVLESLARLAKDESISAAIKLLATSATKTVVVHTAFQEDDALLSVTELPTDGA